MFHVTDEELLIAEVGKYDSVGSSLLAVAQFSSICLPGTKYCEY
jgi:hypothetical protein